VVPVRTEFWSKLPVCLIVEVPSSPGMIVVLLALATVVHAVIGNAIAGCKRPLAVASAELVEAGLLFEHVNRSEQGAQHCLWIGLEASDWKYTSDVVATTSTRSCGCCFFD
jgi:hypothetical protein